MSTATTPSSTNIDGVQCAGSAGVQEIMEIDSLGHNNNNGSVGTGGEGSKPEVDFVAHLGKLKKQRDSNLLQLCLLATADSGDNLSAREVELTADVEKLNHQIKIFKDALSSTLKAASSGASKHAPQVDELSTGIRLSRQDIPKFQLKSQANRYFPGSSEAYDTVEMFIRQFEKVITSAGFKVYNCWKNLIPLSFPIELDAWLNSDLLSCPTWTDACRLLNKKFGSSQAVFQAKRRVINMSMNIIFVLLVLPVRLVTVGMILLWLTSTSMVFTKNGRLK